jgi:parallel beta-helix repeat protein
MPRRVTQFISRIVLSFKRLLAVDTRRKKSASFDSWTPMEVLEVRTLLSSIYVSTTGSDQGNGTAASPWQTLQFAANHVQAGDEVFVSAGNYTGFNLTTSGTATNRITFHGEPGAVINSPGVTGDDINLEGASDITIEGFTTTNATRAGIRSVTNHDVIIQDNDADQNGMWGIFTSYSDRVDIENNIATRSAIEHGIYVSHATDHPIIRGNQVWGNNVNGIHLNSGVNQSIVGALVEDNVIYDNGRSGGSAISCDGLEQSTIQNNLIYNNHFFGISLYRSTSTQPSMGNLVQDNTVVMAADGFYALNIRNGSIDNTVQNNVFTSMLMDSDCIPGYQADHNAIVVAAGQNLYLSADTDQTHLNLPGWQQATGNDLHSMVLTPDQVFQGFAQGNYHLAASSPLQGIGYDASPTTAPGSGVAPPGNTPVAATTLHLQFGTLNSPVAPGYTAVNQTTAYTAARGYGWQSGSIQSRDDTTPGLTPIQRDYDYTRAATFAVDLQNGTYDVTLTMGDAGWSHDLEGVFLQGAQVASVNTNAGQFYTHTFIATVTNGQLTLKLQDLGGLDPNVVINALDIVAAAPAVSPPTATTFHLEFGTATSPVAAGYTAVNDGTTYSPALGYGWQNGSVSSRIDSTPGLTAIQRGYDYTRAATFAVDLPNGTYNVTVTMGDAGWSHDLEGVFLQGAQVGSVSTAAGQYYIHTYVAAVTNGHLTLQLQDLGGVDPNVVINALDIVPAPALPANTAAPTSAPASPTNLHLEFGGSTSPVAAGYVAVDSGTLYTPTSGYGWQSGNVLSRTDTTTGLTPIQASYDYTQAATFAVDLPNGTYDITVTMGDAGWSHDREGVFFQGTQVASVTTNAGQYYIHTFVVTVTNGQLTMKLQDLGGLDPNVVINSLDIAQIG